MTSWMSRVVLMGSLLVLAACAGPQGPGVGAPGEEPAAGDAARDADRRAGATLGDGFAGRPLDDPDSPLAKRTVYFAFDRDDIAAEYQDLISAHAEYLAANPQLQVILEGHTDERGTREYNLALGERRARSVQQLMRLQGVGENQIQTISFGEERPVALGHDESAWQMNRRVELLYPGH